jgi:hypothetical protein
MHDTRCRLFIDNSTDYMNGEPFYGRPTAQLALLWILPLQWSDPVRRQRLAMQFQLRYLLSKLGQPPKCWSENPNKLNHHCMTPKTNHLLITVLTICTGRLFRPPQAVIMSKISFHNVVISELRNTLRFVNFEVVNFSTAGMFDI